MPINKLTSFQIIVNTKSGSKTCIYYFPIKAYLYLTSTKLLPFLSIWCHTKMKSDMKSTFHLNYLFAVAFFFLLLSFSDCDKNQSQSQEQNMKSKEFGKRTRGRGKNLVDRWKTLTHKVSCFLWLPRLKLNLTGYIYRTV